MIKLLRFLGMSMILCLTLSGCAHKITEAQLDRGKHFYFSQDYHTAFIYLERLARKGIPEAEYSIGYMYFYGQGVVENHEMAEYWFSKADDAHYPLAPKALAMLHEYNASIHQAEPHIHTAPDIGTIQIAKKK